MSRLHLLSSILSTLLALSAEAAELEVHFVYVGQGDQSIVKTPDGKNILIDSGSTRDGDVNEARRYLQHALGPSGKVDVLVVTHPDADHYNYLPDVLTGITVDKVLYVGDPSEYQQADFNTWLSGHANAIALTPSDVSAPAAPSPHFATGDTSFFVLAADTGGTAGEKNTRSIVLLVSYKDFDFLLTGDATRDTEDDILERYPAQFLDVELLKLGHHGSNTSSTDPWLSAVRAETAVVSAGYNSPYAHPRLKVIERVEQHTEDAPSHRFRWGLDRGIRLSWRISWTTRSLSFPLQPTAILSSVAMVNLTRLPPMSVFRKFLNSLRRRAKLAIKN